MSGAFSAEYDAAGRVAGQPIPIKPQVPEAGVYPIEALSPRLYRAALAIMDKVQLPAAIAAQSVLAAAALGVQPFINIRLPTGEIVPTSLFLITVAESGERKSSADKLALRAVRIRESEMHDDHMAAQSSHLADAAAYRAARKKAEAGAKSRDEIRRQIEACGAEPVGPPLPLLISDEGTFQGLQKLFAEAMPSLGLFSDEGGQWLGGFAMSADNRVQTGAGLSKLWDGAPIKRVRGTEAATILRGRRLCLHLMIQGRIAKQLFSDKELKSQGLLSRILVCHPKSLKGERMWHDPGEDAALDLEKYDARLHGLLQGAMPMDPETRELKPVPIPLSADAKLLYVAWHDAVEIELRKGGAFEEISGFAAKLPEHSARIAAVMAFFEDRELIEISATALSAGIKIAKFHAEEALRLFGVASVDEDTDNASVLIDWIRSKSLPAVGMQYMSRNAPSQVRAAPVLKRAVALLIEMKHLTQISGGATIKIGDKEKFYRDAYTVVEEETEDME